MNKASLISALQGTQPAPYTVVDQQSINDIIGTIVQKHKECTRDYDRIAGYFDKGSDDVYSTCQQIWNFCKNNLTYSEESETWQYCSCPYTILTGTSVDCKNYALFIGGVLDALKRRGMHLTWKFRFASYDLLEPRPGHVFVVVNENTDNIWVDPVLDSFNQHLYYWYKRDRRPTVMSLGKIAGLPSVGNAAGDQLQSQLIEYAEGVTGAVQLGKQTNTINTITQGVLMTASLAVPVVAAAIAILKAAQPLFNNAFGVGSAAARVYNDITSFNVVGLFNDLFNGRTYQYQIYWLAAMHQYYVLGKSNITNQDQMTDADVWPAVKWFIDRTGVYISGTQTIAALVKGRAAYIALAKVNGGITTDTARVDDAVRVAQTYWSGVPIDPGSTGNFLPGRAGSWANTIGVFDLGIAQIAQQYGMTPEQYVEQTGIDYTTNPTGTSSSSQLIPGIDNLWLVAAGVGVLVLAEIIGD